MRRDEALRRLAEHRDELAAMGAGSLSLFGSVARDEAGPDSDVDILIELNRPIGLFDPGGIQVRLEEIMGCKVDLVMPDTLRPRLRSRVLAGAPKDWTIGLEDMLEAAERVRSFTIGMDVEAFIANRMVVDAVLYNLRIVTAAT